MTDPLSIIWDAPRIAEAFLEGRDATGKIGNIPVSLSLNRSDLFEDVYVPEIDRSFNSLVTSQTMRGLVSSYQSAHPGATISINIDSRVGAESGTLHFGDRHIMVLATDQTRYQYRNTNGTYSRFTMAHIMAHEFTHVFTDMDDGPKFNSIVNRVIGQIDGSLPRSNDYYDILAPEHCFLAGTPISMWPVDAGIEPDIDGLYDEAALRAAIWEKPIEHITADDWVVSYDADGNLKPGRVKRTFRNEAKIILDFHGTLVTPGHVYYCTGGKYEGQHVPLIDILRDDGAVQHEDGSLIRASTGCEVGSDDDKSFWAFLLEECADGTERIREKKLLRFGTRFMVPNGRDFSMREYLCGIGVEIIESGPHEGYARFRKTGMISVFAWTLSERLPNPEDFVLARSQTTLEDIYQASEWEAVRPRMPAPMVMDGGPIQPMAAQESVSIRKNTPMAFLNDAPSSGPKLNRKARKAEAAKQCKIKQASSRAEKDWGTLH